MNENIIPHKFSVTTKMRERLNNHKGLVIWFTGLSGSGKSTIAHALDLQLNKNSIHTYILDGDNIRSRLNSDLSFSEADREENIRRIGEVSALFADAGEGRNIKSLVKSRYNKNIRKHGTLLI